jgi:hypothetical protein
MITYLVNILACGPEWDFLTIFLFITPNDYLKIVIAENDRHGV